MRPKATANQLTHVLRAALPEPLWFPVNPLLIAKEYRVEVFNEDLGAGIEGAMLGADGKHAIVINTRIREAGRRNFTAAHELGHYLLHRDRNELRCSIEDLLDVAPHPVNIEQEANEFAMTLLMPADDVRAQASDQRPSMALLKRLSQRYGTSLTATALRIREISQKAFTLVYINNGRVKWSWPTGHFRWRLVKNFQWPSSLVHSDEPNVYPTEATFGSEASSRLGDKLWISGTDMPSYEAGLWIVETLDERRPWEWTPKDDIDHAFRA